MVKVAPLALHLLMCFAQQGYRLAPPVAALLASGDATLRRFQRSFRFAIPARSKDTCAVRERGERLYPKVYARLLARCG
jgi:hypothetical protein